MVLLSLVLWWNSCKHWDVLHKYMKNMIFLSFVLRWNSCKHWDVLIANWIQLMLAVFEPRILSCLFHLWYNGLVSETGVTEIWMWDSPGGGWLCSWRDVKIQELTNSLSLSYAADGTLKRSNPRTKSVSVCPEVTLDGWWGIQTQKLTLSLCSSLRDLMLWQIKS